MNVDQKEESKATSAVKRKADGSVEDEPSAKRVVRYTHFGCITCVEKLSPSPWSMNCSVCAQRTLRLKSQVLNPALYQSFTLILMPQIPAYVNQSIINTTLHEWREKNQRCVFTDGLGRPFLPPSVPHCLFNPLTPVLLSRISDPSPSSMSQSFTSSSTFCTSSSSTSLSSISGKTDCPTTPSATFSDRDRIQFFAISDSSSLSKLFCGPLLHLSFLRHLLFLEDVKSSCKASRNGEKFLQCRENDALCFCKSTLAKVRQLNPVHSLTSASTKGSASTPALPATVLFSSVNESASAACPCGCVLPAAVIIHTFNIPTWSRVKSTTSFTHFTRCRIPSFLVSVSGVMPRTGRGRPALVTDFTDLQNVPAMVLELFYERDGAPVNFLSSSSSFSSSFPVPIRLLTPLSSSSSYPSSSFSSSSSASSSNSLLSALPPFPLAPVFPPFLPALSDSASAVRADVPSGPMPFGFPVVSPPFTFPFPSSDTLPHPRPPALLLPTPLSLSPFFSFPSTSASSSTGLSPGIADLMRQEPQQQLLPPPLVHSSSSSSSSIPTSSSSSSPSASFFSSLPSSSSVSPTPPSSPVSSVASSHSSPLTPSDSSPFSSPCSPAPRSLPSSPLPGISSVFTQPLLPTAVRLSSSSLPSIPLSVLPLSSSFQRLSESSAVSSLPFPCASVFMPPPSFPSSSSMAMGFPFSFGFFPPYYAPFSPPFISNSVSSSSDLPESSSHSH